MLKNKKTLVSFSAEGLTNVKHAVNSNTKINSSVGMNITKILPIRYQKLA